MQEQPYENPERLAPKSKAEVSRSVLSSQEKAEQQMDAKLNLLEVAVLDVCATNPEFNVEDFYLGMCELVYAEEFPVNKIEKVVDVIDSYPFSKPGAKKFNDLVKAGDYTHLFELLKRNLEGLDLAESIDLPKNDMNAIRATVASLGELSVEIRRDGPTYKGKVIMYGIGDPAPLWVRVLYGHPSTSVNPSEKTTSSVQRLRNSQEGVTNILDAAARGESVNPFGGISQDDLDAAAEFETQIDEENAQARAALEEEYEIAKEETDISPEDFMAERGMDIFGRPLRDN